jgi:autotransporter adhesin
VTGDLNSAFGNSAGQQVSGYNNTAGGVLAGTTVSGNSNVALGHNAGRDINASHTISVGTNSRATASNAIAIGRGATATKGRSVALGQGSVANAADTVSVGSNGLKRRIVNVAAAVNPNDAVNLAQLQAATAAPAAESQQQEMAALRSLVARLEARLDQQQNRIVQLEASITGNTRTTAASPVN